MATFSSIAEFSHHLFDENCCCDLKEHKAQDREGAAIHAWLEDHVVTDTVYMATEDIVWEALWDQARKLKKKGECLKKQDSKVYLRVLLIAMVMVVCSEEK